MQRKAVPHDDAHMKLSEQSYQDHQAGHSSNMVGSLANVFVSNAEDRTL